MSRLRFSWAFWLSAIALALMVAVAVQQSLAFRTSVEKYVRQDLRARAELAAHTLEEPLRTQDLRRIHAFGDECRERDLIIRVINSNREGVFFENVQGAKPDFCEMADCAGYRIVLGVNGARLMRPFSRSIVIAVVAFLLGASGMIFIFFAFYRQRAQLRALEQLEQERMKFITSFTHELKTPLTGIIGAIDLMPKNNPLTEMIKKSAQRLDTLAADLIDFHFGKRQH